MKIMLKKYLFTAYSLLLSVALFAQDGGRSARPERFADPEPNTSTPGGPGTPIDNYIYILIGLAILAIIYIVYRNKQITKA